MMRYIRGLFQGDQTSRIDLTDISAADCVLIQTQNSTYTFSITDAGAWRGFLSGGPLGEMPHVAALVGGVEEEGETYMVDYDCLRVGARASFYLESEPDSGPIITSPIIGLMHMIGDRLQRRIA